MNIKVISRSDKGSHIIQKPATTRKRIICKTCGTRNESSNKFCKECATSILAQL